LESDSHCSAKRRGISVTCISLVSGIGVLMLAIGSQQDILAFIVSLIDIHGSDVISCIVGIVDVKKQAEKLQQLVGNSCNIQ